MKGKQNHKRKEKHEEQTERGRMLTLVQKCVIFGNRLAMTGPLKPSALSASIRQTQIRYKTKYRTGAFKPMPAVNTFGVFGILCSVIPGLFIGAAISKSVANFLEENDLFVPSEDDDDDD